MGMQKTQEEMHFLQVPTLLTNNENIFTTLNQTAPLHHKQLDPQAQRMMNQTSTNNKQLFGRKFLANTQSDSNRQRISIQAENSLLKNTHPSNSMSMMSKIKKNESIDPHNNYLTSSQNLEGSQEMTSMINKSEENFLDNLKSQLPSHIVNLLLQPKREGVNFNEFEDKSFDQDPDQSMINLIPNRTSEEDIIDDKALQEALILQDTDFRSFIDKTVSLKAKSDEIPFLIFSYKSKCRMYWDLLIIMLSLYNCIMIPIEVAFGQDFFSAQAKSYLSNLEYSIDAIFACDIFASLRTTYLNIQTGKEVVSPKKIAARYVFKGSIFIDLIATIPIDDIIEKSISIRIKQVGLLGLLKMTRMLRLRKIITFMNVQQSLKSSIRIVQLIMLLLLSVHWIGCIWYMLVDIELTGQENIWVPLFELDDTENTYFYQQGPIKQYLITSYYAVIGFIGRANEIAPVTLAQTGYSAFIVILGSFMSTFVVGNIAATIENAGTKDSKFQERMDIIQSSMALIGLPEQLQDEVIKYILQVEQAPEVQHDLHIFLESISPSLKSQVLNYLHGKVLMNLSELKDAHETEINFLASKLGTVLVMSGDLILKQGSVGKEMYFLLNGQADIILEKTYYKTKPDDKDGRRLSKMKSISQPLYKSNNDDSFSLENSHDNSSIIDKSNQQSSANTSIIIDAVKQHQKKKHYFTTSQPIGKLEKGQYFGEISIISRLKRTTTIKATENCTLSTLNLQTMGIIKTEYPQLYMNFKRQIGNYVDEDMIFRLKIIRNIPYFSNISNDLNLDLFCLLRESVHDYNSLIVKSGDITDRIFIIWKGSIRVEVSQGGQDYEFEKLCKGSCFCVFSSFTDEYTSIFNFKVISPQAFIYTLKVSDIMKLSNTNLELMDILKQLQIQIKNKQKSDFDFFRYHSTYFELTEKQRRLLRIKFRNNLLTIARNINNKIYNLPEAIIVIQEICKQRQMRVKLLNKLKMKKNVLQQNEPVHNPLPKNYQFPQKIEEENSSRTLTASSKMTNNDPENVDLYSYNKQEEYTKTGDDNIFFQEYDKKEKRFDLLKDILNTQDVPGIDLRIFEKIDGLPEDKCMYTSKTLKQFENLTARINQQRESKDAIQFLNRLIFKQNSQLYELKVQFEKQVQDIEMKITKCAQQIRKSKQVQREKKQLTKKINTFFREPESTTQEVQEYDIQKMMSYQRTPDYNGTVQINITNQFNNFITIGANEELDVLDQDTLTHDEKSTERERARKFSAEGKDTETDFYYQNYSNNKQFNQGSKQSSAFNITNGSSLQKQQMGDKLKTTKKKLKSTKELQKRFNGNKQSRLLERNASQNKTKKTKKQGATRSLSPIVGPQAQSNDDEKIMNQRPDFGKHISQVATMAEIRSKVLDSPRSYQRYIKEFSTTRQLPDKTLSDKTSSVYIDRRGGASLEDKVENISQQEYGNDLPRISSKEDFDLSNLNKQSRLNQRLSKRGDSQANNYNKLKMIPQPQRPFTRDQSRIGRHNFRTQETEPDILSQQNMHPRNNQMTTIQGASSRRLINFGFYRQQESEGRASENFYSSAITIQRQNNQEPRSNNDYSNNRLTQQESDFNQYSRQFSLKPYESPYKKELTAKQSKSSKKYARVQSAKPQISKLKISKEDKEKWDFYRKMIEKNKRNQQYI